MDTALFDELTERFGYLSMFLFSWLLFFGLPLPNELAASFAGMITTELSYNPMIAFFSTYFGLISSATAAYGIGRLLGPRVERFLKKSRYLSNWQKGTSLLNRFGSSGIAISFFIPGVRWAMPYIVGLAKHEFWKFCLFAYSAALIWTFIYFQIGRSFPLIYPEIIDNLKYFVPAGAIIVGLVIIFVQFKKSNRKERGV
ncbi:DedA family protein [Jeotgalibacillus proteolyticus]|uniref:DedA family protein n=1 Tax=Jeotgalibacillus proteolyticus TaxID=2082395 RepID=A0A2S5GFZ0_9BACL|nr:DedA family protein [Jeotgalibacillus proteolyticus]PPA71831.1 DedA family protein [Jeotgalibacillus proteolyticus]